MTSERWWALPLSTQIGNIGSEITRARIWREKQETENESRALERAIQLLDMTLENQQLRREQVRELTLFHEYILAWKQQHSNYIVKPQLLENYCIQITTSRFR